MKLPHRGRQASRKRMKDGIFRRAIKGVALLRFIVDLRATRWIRRARGERPYLLGGNCALCAKCCESPAIQVNSWTYGFKPYRKLFLAWQKHINGFELLDADPGTRTFTFRCTHFDWSTRRCDSYRSRPGMCRDYPRLLLWESEPPLLPGCGYRAIAPNADRVAELLEKEGVPPEKLEEIKRKLRLH